MIGIGQILDFGTGVGPQVAPAVGHGKSGTERTHHGIDAARLAALRQKFLEVLKAGQCRIAHGTSPAVRLPCIPGALVGGPGMFGDLPAQPNGDHLLVGDNPVHIAGLLLNPVQLDGHQGGGLPHLGHFDRCRRLFGANQGCGIRNKGRIGHGGGPGRPDWPKYNITPLMLYDTLAGRQATKQPSASHVNRVSEPRAPCRVAASGRRPGLPQVFMGTRRARLAAATGSEQKGTASDAAVDHTVPAGRTGPPALSRKSQNNQFFILL